MPADHALEILLTEEQIRNRVQELGRQIRQDIGEDPIVLLCVLKGAFPFLADLARAIPGDVIIDFVQTSSWMGGRTSSGSVRILRDHDVNIEGKHVLLIEDIVDTGLTLSYLKEILATRQPASLRVASLLSKPEARIHHPNIEYLGFEIPDKFVVGYGLDDGERYRNLPYVAVLSPLNDPSSDQ